MDVDVDLFRGDVEEDDGDGKAALHQQPAVGVLDGGGDGAVDDGAAVDEEGYAGSRGAAALRRGGKPPDGIGAGPGRHVEHRGGHVRAEDGRRGVAEGAVAGGGELRFAVRSERHSDVGVGEREALGGLADAGGFGGGGADELEAGGNGGEEGFDLDGGSGRGAGLGAADDLAALQFDGGGGFGVGRSRGHSDGRGGGDAGERFAAKAERGDPGEVVLGLEFAGGVPLKCERDLVGGDAAAVVGYADGGEPAVPDIDLDGRRARVEGVLDEFLDDGRRALDDLAGGDARGDGGRQRSDGHRRSYALGGAGGAGASAGWPLPKRPAARRRNSRMG